MTTAPDISIALLTRNAGALLERLLEAVATQKTTHRVETVAVDSGSTDGTRERLERHGARVVTIDPAAFNFGTTRDQVFGLAQGKVIVSLSQDAIPAHPHWLENLIAPLDEPGVAVSCGRSLFDPQRDDPQFPWEANGLFYFTREMKTFAQRYGRGLSNANAAYRRDVWGRLRFSSQSIGEDYLFQTKLHAEGLRIAFSQDAPVLHHHNYTLASLWARCRREGTGLRQLDCPYSFADMAADLASPRKYMVWGKSLLLGRLRTPAALLFPVLRPIAVYAGNLIAGDSTS